MSVSQSVMMIFDCNDISHNKWIICYIQGVALSLFEWV